MAINTSLDLTPVEILLVEDNQAHADLAAEALKGVKVAVNLSVVETGEEALEYLHNEKIFKDAKAFI